MYLRDDVGNADSKIDREKESLGYLRSFTFKIDNDVG